MNLTSVLTYSAIALCLAASYTSASGLLQCAWRLEMYRLMTAIYLHRHWDGSFWFHLTNCLPTKHVRGWQLLRSHSCWFVYPNPFAIPPTGTDHPIFFLKFHRKPY